MQLMSHIHYIRYLRHKKASIYVSFLHSTQIKAFRIFIFNLIILQMFCPDILQLVYPDCTHSKGGLDSYSGVRGVVQ